MPTNFKRSFRRRVHLKGPDDHCSWLRHFERGTCARSLWGHLESLDTVKQSRFYFGSIKSLYANARKFRNKKVVGLYRPGQVDRTLAEFRELGLITLQYENEDLHDLKGFTVANQAWHDAKSQREGRYCFYSDDPLPPLVELGKKYPDSRVFITPEEKAVLDATAEKDRAAALAGIASGIDAGIDKSAPGIDAGIDAGIGTIENGDRRGDRLKPPQTPETPMVAAPSEKLGSQFGAPEAVEAVEEVNQSLQAKEANQATTKGEEGLFCSSSMTDQKQNLRPCKDNDQKQGEAVALRKLKTIGEHFEGRVTIDEISNGEIDWKVLDEKYRYTHVSEDTMISYCQAAVDEIADQPYLGPQTHGRIMVAAMLALDKAEGRKAPECWYKVAKELRASPPVFAFEDTHPNALDWKKLFEYAGVGWQDNDYFPLCDTYREGWQFLADCHTNDHRQVRDWLWEHDAMPDKPASPPWKKP